MLAKPQNLHINDSATEAWHFIAEACISREQAGGNPCTRPWHARHMSTDGSDAVDEGENSDLLGDRLHLEIGSPVPGDVVVCTPNMEFVCPIDLILYMPVSTRPSGGEVLLVRLGTKVVRSLTLSSDPNHADVCPRMSGASPAKLDIGACWYKLSLRDIRSSGDFTIRVDVVGEAFSYRSILHSPKVSFSVVMERTCGADQDVLVTLVHYGSTHNLTRAIRALHDAAIVRIVRRPSVDPSHLHTLARAEEATRALTSLLTAERCRHVYSTSGSASSFSTRPISMPLWRIRLMRASAACAGVRAPRCRAPQAPLDCAAPAAKSATSGARSARNAPVPY